MHVLHFGVLASLLSESLVSSFSLATSLHVLIAMLTEMFGVLIKQPRYFAVVSSTYQFVAGLSQMNCAALVTSIICITAMMLLHVYVQPFVRRRLHFSLPIELMAVFGGTFASYLLDLRGRWHVRLVGTIQMGLPMPSLPLGSLVGPLMFDALPVTVVSFAMTMTIGNMLARKNGYKPHANQELLALGISNLVGSCFSCLPTGGSITRSLVLEQSGGQTQLVSLVSATLICCVLLWIGPALELLPRVSWLLRVDRLSHMF